MYTVHDEVVLDPFLGSGTTMQVALSLDRRAVGYEINPDYLDFIEGRLEVEGGLFELYNYQVEYPDREEEVTSINYEPSIKNMEPKKEYQGRDENFHRVNDILEDNRLLLDDGRIISFLGVSIPSEKSEVAKQYLRRFVEGKQIYLLESAPKDEGLTAYVYLKNRIFINRKMIEMSLAIPDANVDHKQKNKFQKVFEELKNG